MGEALLTGEKSLADFAGANVIVPRVKIIADGSIQGYTGYLSEPYYQPFKGDAGYRGYPSVARDELFRQVAGLYQRRIPVAIHCNGDASIDDGLDAIEAAMEAHPWPEARPLIIHAQMTRKDQIERMASLGVTPSFFSAHTYYWGDRHAAIFMGPARAANMSPARWALDAGIRFSSHLDTPGHAYAALAGGVESGRAGEHGRNCDWAFAAYRAHAGASRRDRRCGVAGLHG